MKKKRKLSVKTIIAMIAFILSFGTCMAIAFSNICLNWSSAIILISLITIAGYSFDYLLVRYERIFK